MSTDLQFTHEIRFKVTAELYNSLQVAASSCSQPVSVFARQLLGEAFLEFQKKFPQFSGQCDCNSEEISD